MSKLFRIDMLICGTAYVRAETADEAAILAAGELYQEALEVRGEMISGQQFDDPELPDVSLSPAMTVHGVWPGANAEECDE